VGQNPGGAWSGGPWSHMESQKSGLIQSGKTFRPAPLTCSVPRCSYSSKERRNWLQTATKSSLNAATFSSDHCSSTLAASLAVGIEIKALIHRLLLSATTMVEGTTADSVPTVRTHVSVFTWHCSGLPVRKPTQCRRHRRTSTPTLSRHVNTAGPIDTTLYPW